MSIQDQFSFVPVLSSNRVQARADAFLTRFGAGCCICKIDFTLSIQSILSYVHASGFCSEERLILIYTFLGLICFYRCSYDTPGLLFESLRVDSIFGSSCWRCLVDFIWFFFLFLF